jgi:catechol 2,3-dioxygenase-like lactoylglutathione lyase family enzyme
MNDILWRNDCLAPNVWQADYSSMPQPFTLAKSDIIGFVPISNVSAAKEFYGGTLGLQLLSEELPFALVFDANGIMVRLAITPDHAPSRGTVLGWRVPDIAAAVEGLSLAGIRFERYEFLTQDEAGIWMTPTKARVAWFQDPDGNLLSVSEHPEAAR